MQGAHGDRRLEVLRRQLTAGAAGHEVALHSSAGTQGLDFCSMKMRQFQCHDNLAMREAIFEFLKDELYKPNYYLSMLDFREQTLQRLVKFVREGKFFSVQDYLRDPRKFMAALECLSWCDYSLGIKAGVHFTLCGGTICKLGTSKHHEAYLPRLDDLSLTGSFCMTELGHGSNVMGIETTAEYDHATREFIINTPSNEASKLWIGGTGQHGKVTVVFAQLTVGGKWEGVHVFVVRIRDDNMNLMPGVRIKDMGPKQGLNGVDNGQLWFDHVRVPRDALLDAYGSVSEAGVYSSKIPSISQRFGITVGGLTTGRVLIAQGGVDGQKIGLTIAIRYACQRPQFGDKLIMDYVTHQRRLLPALANTYALQFAQRALKDLVDRRRPEDAKAIHVLSSGLKAAATWSRVESLQACRECCGGMGFLSANKIGPMANDMNVDVTFEGDNTVMMQQVARSCLEDKALAPAPPQHPGVRVTASAPPSNEDLSRLLRYREHALTYQVASAVAAAAAKAGGGKGAAERAAGEALEAQLDAAVQLGWANVERFCFDNFVQEVSRADPELRPVLQLLCSLYGMTRVERGMEFFLASGALGAQDRSALRYHVHAAFRLLCADRGRLAVKLCDSFGIPDHLLQAPIAFNWRTFGAASS